MFLMKIMAGEKLQCHAIFVGTLYFHALLIEVLNVGVCFRSIYEDGVGKL